MGSRERVPRVSYQLRWGREKSAHVNVNSDAARTRLHMAVDAIVFTALENETGEASMAITVRRRSKKPTRVRIIERRQ